MSGRLRQGRRHVVAAAKVEPANTSVVPDVALPGYQQQVKIELQPVAVVPKTIRFETVA